MRKDDLRVRAAALVSLSARMRGLQVIAYNIKNVVRAGRKIIQINLTDKSYR